MADQTKTAAITSKPSAVAATVSLGSLSLGRWLSGRSLALGAVGACWLLFFNELRGEWQINAQYNYGYVVPLLGAALLWRRWPERPGAVSGASPTLAGFVAIVMLALLLPLRVVLQANPEWRLPYWVHGFVMIGCSCCLLYRLGGWAWVRYFAPPIVFMLIAVPWPSEWEQTCIQGLMRLVTGLTVTVADGLGIPAVQHGNLVEVGAGVVGIDEACSGVRSLQSALMLSLFLGEMYRFSVLRRIGLLFGSLVFVLLANLTRTSFLVWAAANRGLHQMESWHDAAGNLVMFIVLPGLMLLAYLMKPRNASPAPQSGATQPLVAIPRWIGLSVVVWLGITEVASELWYRSHESQLVSNARWSVAWPTNSPQFKKSAVPEKSLAILRCSDSESAGWQDDAGNAWSGFILRWAPGKNSAQLSKGHRPDTCFPAAGAHLVSDFGMVVVSANGLKLPFRHQAFDGGAGPFHVFYCLWSDRISLNEKQLLEDGSKASRIQAALAGKRHLGQQVLELVIRGPDTDEAAVALLKEQLPALVRRELAGS